jgi:hypothetical protein
MNGLPLAVTAWLRVLSPRIEAQLMSRVLFCMTATPAGPGQCRETQIGPAIGLPRPRATQDQVLMNAISRSVNASGLLSWTR